MRNAVRKAARKPFVCETVAVAMWARCRAWWERWEAVEGRVGRESAAAGIQGRKNSGVHGKAG